MKTDEQYREILRTIDITVPMPAQIENRVITRIRKARSARARIRVGCSLFACIVTLVSVIPALVWFSRAATNSGFYRYISLIISDGKIALDNWNSFVLSIVESLPILETVLVLGIIIVFILALRSIAGNISWRDSALHAVLVN